MPKNLPLRLPPGVVKRGTVYETKGHWYDASLVRWNEGAMGAIGGWTPVVRTSGPAVDAAIADDGGAFTDETTDANNATANDVQLLPVAPAENDAFYIGFDERFNQLSVNVGTVATDGAVTWEYYDGTTWSALTNVTDNTDSFKASGTKIVNFDLPWDWAATTVNSQGPFYYVRARVSTVGTSQALGTQIWIGDGPLDADEVIRGMIGWLANNNQSFLAYGTPTKLYEYHQGAVTAITPAGFTTGNTDATIASGNYGNGVYGDGNYGEGDPGIVEIVEAQTWQIDTFGEDLVAVAYSDGKAYTWDRSAGGAATQITNSPTGCRGIVVTPERFVVVLGASGNLPTGAEGDRREVIWSDQEAMTTWEPLTTNQAGSYVLPGAGKLMAGRRSRSETLLWTDVDFYSMRWVGGDVVYSFQQVGSQCGAISRMCMTAVDGKAFWMGHRKFFVYDGFVDEIACLVSNYVFDDLNRTQASKIFAVTIAEFNTVMWFYPSAGSTENDRYVAFNWSTNHWEIGQLQRTAGIDRSAFSYPIMTDASGIVYDHERGDSYLDPDGVTLTPYAESGPVELGAGDQVMEVVGVIPDENTLGDVQLKIYTTFYPTESETLSAAFTAREPTDVRLSARQVRLRAEQVSAGWKFGVPRLMVEAGGRR